MAAFIELYYPVVPASLIWSPPRGYGYMSGASMQIQGKTLFLLGDGDKLSVPVVGPSGKEINFLFSDDGLGSDSVMAHFGGTGAPNFSEEGVSHLRLSLNWPKRNGRQTDHPDAVCVNSAQIVFPIESGINFGWISTAASIKDLGMEEGLAYPEIWEKLVTAALQTRRQLE